MKTPAMPRTSVVCVLLLAFAPVVAAQDHSRHQPPPATEVEADESKRDAAQDSTGQEKQPEAVDHAAMGHAAPPASDPHAGHTAPAGPAEPAEEDEPIDHSTHGTAPDPDPEPSAMDHGAMDHGQAPAAPIDHSTMDHGQAPTPTPVDHSAMGHAKPAAPTEPREPIPVLTDADRAAAFAPLDGHATHDNRIVRYTQFNRLEASDGDHGTGLSWEGSGWIGTDWNRLWMRSEGEREGGRTEAADLELLYGRPVARWWDAVVGLRHDFRPGPSQTWLAVGVMGLAPQWFEVEATAYLGESGQVAARAEVEYELLLTNRLILQPLLEVELHSEDDAERGIGSGLSTAEAGLRLRYEVTRQFAPYIGVAWERAYGGTADLRRAEGEDIDDTRLVAGVRFWF